MSWNKIRSKPLSPDDILDLIIKDGEFFYGVGYHHDITDQSLLELMKIGLIKQLKVDKPTESNADFRYVSAV